MLTIPAGTELAFRTAKEGSITDRESPSIAMESSRRNFFSLRSFPTPPIPTRLSSSENSARVAGRATERRYHEAGSNAKKFNWYDHFTRLSRREAKFERKFFRQFCALLCHPARRLRNPILNDSGILSARRRCTPKARDTRPSVVKGT